MKKLLIPIDALNTARTRAAVEEAVRLWREQPAAVHLLSVQPPVSGHVAMFFGARELQHLHEQVGVEELAPARSLLDRVGVPYTFSVRIGRRAATIARAARELGCDAIVMGQDGGAGFVHHMLGSVAEQVRQLVPAADCRVIGS